MYRDRRAFGIRRCSRSRVRIRSAIRLRMTRISRMVRRRPIDAPNATLMLGTSTKKRFAHKRNVHLLAQFGFLERTTHGRIRSISRLPLDFSLSVSVATAIPKDFKHRRTARDKTRRSLPSLAAPTALVALGHKLHRRPTRHGPPRRLGRIRNLGNLAHPIQRHRHAPPRRRRRRGSNNHPRLGQTLRPSTRIPHRSSSRSQRIRPRRLPPRRSRTSSRTSTRIHRSTKTRRRSRIHNHHPSPRQIRSRPPRSGSAVGQDSHSRFGVERFR